MARRRARACSTRGAPSSWPDRGARMPGLGFAGAALHASHGFFGHQDGDSANASLVGRRPPCAGAPDGRPCRAGSEGRACCCRRLPRYPAATSVARVAGCPQLLSPLAALALNSCEGMAA